MMAANGKGTVGTIAFLALAALSVAVLAYVGFSSSRLLTSVGRTLFFAGLPSAALLCCLLALRLPAAIRDTLAVIVVSVAAGAYLAEGYLTLRPAKAGPDRPGFDTRTKYEVVRDLRNTGQAAYPAVFPNYLLQTGSDGRTHSPLRLDDGREVLPLGGIARVPTVLCNEAGTWVIHPSDEMGFNNPPGLWDGRPVEAMTLGDSFTQGYCVEPAASYVGLIRAALPTTVNVGTSGSGPLLELAALAELGPVLKPRRILWFFYEGNDLEDLNVERRSPLLMAALDGAGPQGLFAVRAKVDAALRAHVDGLIGGDAGRRETDAGPLQATLSFVGLAKLREALALPSAMPPPDHALMRRVLERASAVARSWGGQLTLVYLPDSTSLVPGHRAGAGAASVGDAHGPTIATATALGIPVIDVRAALSRHADPLSLYPFRIPAHFNEAGHAAVAAVVLDALGEHRY